MMLKKPAFIASLGKHPRRLAWLAILGSSAALPAHAASGDVHLTIEAILENRKLLFHATLFLTSTGALSGTIMEFKQPCKILPGSTNIHHRLSMTCQIAGPLYGNSLYQGTLNIATGMGQGVIIAAEPELVVKGRYKIMRHRPPPPSQTGTPLP